MFFGIPETLPSIQGYEIIAKAGDWLTARKDGVTYYLCEHSDKWELCEKGYNPNFVGKSNPDGHFAHTEKPLFIPK